MISNAAEFVLIIDEILKTAQRKHGDKGKDKGIFEPARNGESL
jgi:hypothetical protein